MNLVLSIEWLGDARLKAEDPTAAGRILADGLAAVGEAPGSCFAQSQLDQLKDSARDAQQERGGGQQRDEYLRNNNHSTGPDRPW